jgi:ATP-dependent helicase/nuclease subunit B
MTGSERTTAIERHWIDWDRPMLPGAAAWLIDRYRGEDGVVDMQGVLCVLPGRRAGRVLTALLAAACDEQGLAFVPPRTITPGTLTAVLPADEAPMATGAEQVFAWLEALKQCAAGEVEALLPSPPEEDDVLAWHELARTIDGLHEELAGENLTFADVPVRAECLEMFAEGDRWRALAAVARRYHDVLASCGLDDPHAAQRAQLETRGVDRTAEIILIGVTELNAAQRAIVSAVGERATALIHAPSSLADHFDALGCVVPEAWADAEIVLDDERIAVTETPADQAQAAISAIAAFDGARAADQITIGVSDASLVGPVMLAADWAGLQVHSAAGTELRRSAPFRLLEAIAGWLADGRFASLAALVRHPDLESWLMRRTGRTAAGASRGVTDWLTLLDRYFSDHLHERPAGRWLGEPERRQRLRLVWNEVHALLSPLAGADRPLGAWSGPVLEVLGSVYAHLEPQRAGAHERAAIAACLNLHEVLARQARVKEALQPRTDAATAIGLLLAEAATETVASDVRADQIEMLGWLELHLDPAPALILLGVNDGRIPEAVSADLFLPDALRKALGLMRSNDRRYARDAYLLQAIVRSREQMTIISGRRDARGEPLQPSRLLLACDDETLVARIRRLCAAGDDVDEEQAARALPIGAPPCGPVSAFTVPALPPDLPAPRSMTVTEFRTYLACPYRYALQRLIGLETVADDAAELDALQFGTLAHEVLERFGSDPEIRESDDPGEIEAYLLRALRQVQQRRYGRDPMPAVRLQMARLEQRLRRFASLQAGLRSEGWAIEHTEFTFAPETKLDIPDEEPMPIRGQIDRIDVNIKTGRRRIIDYKTGERGETPFQAHHGRKTLPKDGETVWRDLQLPLYHYLARRNGIVGNIELAYIVLPKKADDVAVRIADWRPEHLEAAVNTARTIVRDIRAGRFVMKPEFARPLDPFARICQTFAFGDEGEIMADPDSEEEP